MNGIPPERHSSESRQLGGIVRDVCTTMKQGSNETWHLSRIRQTPHKYVIRSLLELPIPPSFTFIKGLVFDGTLRRLTLRMPAISKRRRFDVSIAPSSDAGHAEGAARDDDDCSKQTTRHHLLSSCQDEFLPPSSFSLFISRHPTTPFATDIGTPGDVALIKHQGPQNATTSARLLIPPHPRSSTAIRTASPLPRCNLPRQLRLRMPRGHLPRPTLCLNH